MSDVVLYDYWRSSASYRVRIALNLKGVDHERVSVDLLAGEQRDAANLGRNPQGFVPTLEIDGERITQSLAIMDYLDARFPEPRFVPKDPAARAHVIAQALMIAADIHPINNLRILNYLTDVLGVDNVGRKAWARHWMAEGFRPLEKIAADAGGEFLGGAAPGMADICLVPQFYNARRFGLGLDEFPTLVRIDAACQALPPFAAAHPDQVKPES